MAKGKIIGVANQQVDIHSFPEKDQNEASYSSNTITKLEFKLTYRLLSEVKANEDNADANSGKQACKDLPRMSFIINDRPIDKSFVKQLLDKLKQNDKRQVAKHVFTRMFEYAKAEVPNDHILEELTTHCNQSGYEFMLYAQMQLILAPYNFIPTIPEKIIRMYCNTGNSIVLEYSGVMIAKSLDSERFEEYQLYTKLEFTLKFQNGIIEYENGKVTLTIPEQLSNYKADGKSLLDDIDQNFKDVDNAVVESLITNIGEGSKSFVAGQKDLNSDEELSLVIIPRNPILELESVVELVKRAIDTKDVDALSACIGVVQDDTFCISPEKGLTVVEKILEIVGNFTKEQDKVWGTYPATHIVGFIYSTSQCYYNSYISQKVKSFESTLCEIKSNLIKRSCSNYNKVPPTVFVEGASFTTRNQTEFTNLVVNENCSTSSINSFDNRLVYLDYHTTIKVQDFQCSIEQATDKKIIPNATNRLSASDKKSVFTEKEKNDSIGGARCSKQEPISDSCKEVKMPNSVRSVKVSGENNEKESSNMMKPFSKQSTQSTSRKVMNNMLYRQDRNPASRSENLTKISSLNKTNKKSSLTQRRLSPSTQIISNVGKNIDKLKQNSSNPEQSLTEKTNELMSAKAQLTEKGKELNDANQRVSQLEQELSVAKQKLEELKNGKIQEMEDKIKQLAVVESKNNDLKTQVQKSESKNEQLENRIKDLEKQLRSKNKNMEGKKEKNLTVSAGKIKDKINCTSAFFILSGLCAVGASLPTPYLVIRITLAIVASASLAVVLYCSFNANTALSNVGVDQVLTDSECVVSQSSV